MTVPQDIPSGPLPSLIQSTGPAPTVQVSDVRKKFLDASVAKVSPALYAAAGRTGLTSEERDFINQWSIVKNTHEKLMSMRNVDADIAFKKLDPATQAALTTYYNIDYRHKPGNDTWIDSPGARKFFGLDNGLSVGDIFKSPFRGLMALGGLYGKYMNTPYNAIQNSLANDTEFWSKKNFSDSFDGKMLYDEATVNPLIEKYGGPTSFVAMQLLAGKTPGEIIDAWGPNDPEILVAFNNMFNNEEFAGVIDEFTNAQLSPGRAGTRTLFKKINVDPNNHPKWFDGISGAGDLAFQIFADPLTYLTFGGSAALKLGFKSAQLAERSKNIENIFEFFSDAKEIRQISDYSTRIGKYDDALKSGDEALAGEIASGIRQDFPKFGTIEEINFWKDLGVKDFDSFKAQFIDPKSNTITGPQNFEILARGLTADASYMRENASFAYGTRTLTKGIKAKLNEIFTGPKHTLDDLDKIDVNKFNDDARKLGMQENFTDDDILQVTKNIIQTTGTKTQKFISQQIRRHPGRKTVYVDDDTYKLSLNTLRDQAYFILPNKVQAESFVAGFVNSTPAERFAMKKTLDILTMRQMGLGGHTVGQAVMDAQIKLRYGIGSMSGAGNVLHPKQWETGLEDAAKVEGPLQPSQFKTGIQALDWKILGEAASSIKLKNYSKQDSLLKQANDLIGGAYNHKVTNTIMDTWSALTLLPTLGMRTVFDEGFMNLMYATAGQVPEFIRSNRAGNVLAAYTGDIASSGPVKSLVQKLLSKRNNEDALEYEKLLSKTVSDFTTLTGKELSELKEYIKGFKPNLDILASSKGPAFESISDNLRTIIAIKHFEDLSKTGSIADVHTAIKNELFDISWAKYGNKLGDDYKGLLRELVDVNPSIIRSASASNVTDALLDINGLYKIPKSILNETQLDLLLKESKLVKTGQFDLKNVKQMADADLYTAMFYNLWRFLGSDTYQVGNYKVEKAHPGYIFLKRNGLKTKEDFNNAVDDWMTAVGFKWSNNQWLINDKGFANVTRFLESTRHATQYSNLPLAEQAQKFITDVFADGYQRFHGASDQFNEKLLNQFNEFRSNRASDYFKELNNIKYENYIDLVGKNTAKDSIFTDLVIENTTDLAAISRKYGFNKAFELMARQTDDMYRQPAVIMNYMLYRKEYAAAEKLHLDQKFQSIKKELIKKEEYNYGVGGVPPYVINNIEKKALERATQETSRFWAEKALVDSTHKVLKFSDNPEIRSVFAYNVKTVGRFYRATEDFHRRMYRLTREHGLGTIYRLRLMNQGLAAVGAVHNDQDGEQYLILPMDDLVYSAVNNTLQLLTNKKIGVNQPLFNDMTFKITGANPSFQTDAGVPYLSGPIASISIAGVQKVLGLFNPTASAAEDLDTMLLGDLGDNPTFKTAFTPKLVKNIWKMLSPDERSAEEVSAFTQAIAYNEANGLGLRESDWIGEDGKLDQAKFDEAKRKYIETVKVSAHNIIVMRSLLGMILPVSVQRSNTKDLPDYLKDVGVTSMQDSFYQVLDQIKKKYPDAEEPYELALATWMGENPGKVAYIVSPNNKAIKPVLDYSNDMQDWAIKNRDAIKEYGTSALIFAPHTGEFNPGVWRWAEAQGLTYTIPSDVTASTFYSEFYDKVFLKKSVNEYYALNDKEAEELRTIPFGSTNNRRAVIDFYTKAREDLKLKVPGLENYLATGADNSEAEELVLGAHTFVNQTKSVSPEVRDSINKMYDLYTEFVDKANYINSLNSEDGPELKRIEKSKTIAAMQELIKQDKTKAVEQYYNYGIFKLMTAISRDAQAGLHRNVIK